MRRVLTNLMIIAAVMVAGRADADDLVWANRFANMSDGANWNPSKTPTSSDRLIFSEKPIVQPYLDENLTVKSIWFADSGDLNHISETKGMDYRIIGVDGAVLTLSGYGKSSQTIMNLTKGTNWVEVPLAFQADAKDENNGIWFQGEGNNSTRGRVIFAKEISTAKNEQQIYICDGEFVFAHANPNFAPVRFGWRQSARVGVADPQAFAAVKNVYVSNWAADGSDKTTRLMNETGGAFDWPSLEEIYVASTDALSFEGDPVIMTNCVLLLKNNDGKARRAQAAVTIRKITAGQDTTYINGGTNMWEAVEDLSEEGGTCQIRLEDGMYYPHNLFGGAIRSGRQCRFMGNPNNSDINQSSCPTIGVNQNADIPLSYLGGISFGESGGDRSGGFSGMGGTREIWLTVGGSRVDLLGKQKLSSGEAYMTPDQWVFGNRSATGTAKLMNNVTLTPSGKAVIMAIKGFSDVAGRFAGDVIYSKDLGTGMFFKGGDGVIAFDKSFTPPSNNCSIKNGGVLLNFADAKGKWKQETIAGGFSWIGGNGTFNGSFEFDNRNGTVAIAGGDFGEGEFKITSGVKLPAGGGILVNFRKGKAGCVTCVGSGEFTAAGGNFIKIDLEPDAPIQGKAKVLDWSGYTGNLGNATMFDLSNYEIIWDHEKIDSLTVLEKDKAVWISYMCAASGFKVMVR